MTATPTKPSELDATTRHLLDLMQDHFPMVERPYQALGEQILHDPETGQQLTASFMDYQMPRADELPGSVAIQQKQEKGHEPVRL